MTERAFYTPKEVGEMLGVSRSKVHDLLETGEIPSVHFGAKARRIPRRLFDEYVQSKIQDAVSGQNQRKVVPLAR